MTSREPSSVVDKDTEVLHYARQLPAWRFHVRQKLVPFIRAETSYLAYLQESLRRPALDSYFAMTANLGTHTFYMVMLPVLFWGGYISAGRAFVHMLALGVCMSGLLKDLLCLPRPASPPLQRITMSGHVSLEYGFPSTHSTNAVSVGIYLTYLLYTVELTTIAHLSFAFQCLLLLYVVSISFGRIYCGMHGFLDVLTGAVLGALIGFVQCLYGSALDAWICHGSWVHIAMVISASLLFIGLHPEPVDNCPCFDDSVAFAGVIMGINIGGWQWEQSAWLSSMSGMGTGTGLYASLRLLVRVIVGIFIVFAWRGITKPILLKILPPFFRVIQKRGLTLPRRYFLQANKYKNVPSIMKDDNVIPSVSQLPAIISSLSHPRRRAVSVGPQTAADVYETMAYISRQRRSSISVAANSDTFREEWSISSGTGLMRKSYDSGQSAIYSPTVSISDNHRQSLGHVKRNSSVLAPVEEIGGFAKLASPRMRYDVEVVTKLIVYSGIGWITVVLNPLIFIVCRLQ